MIESSGKNIKVDIIKMQIFIYLDPLCGGEGLRSCKSRSRVDKMAPLLSKRGTSIRYTNCPHTLFFLCFVTINESCKLYSIGLFCNNQQEAE